MLSISMYITTWNLLSGSAMMVKKKHKIPEMSGGLHKPLWNGNSEEMGGGGVKTKNVLKGRYVYFLELHISSH